MDGLPEFYVKHEKDHKWDFCELCGFVMVMCGTCHNNCCNGGHGQLPDGSDCPDCKSAYDFQTEFAKEATIFYEKEINEARKKRNCDFFL